MPKRMQNIYKRKDGRWEARYIKDRTIKGKAIYGYLYGKSYDEVKEKLEAALADHKDLRATKEILYKDLADQWLNCEKLKVKESTYVKYSHLMKNHILPGFGQQPLSQLTTSLVISFINDKLTNGRIDQQGGLSLKSVKDMVVVIKSTIHYARMEGMEVPCILESIKLPAHDKEANALSIQDQTKLEDYLMKHMDLCKLGVLLCLYTGMRIGEICALKNEDIMLEDGLIRVHQTLQRIQNMDQSQRRKTKIIITTPKTKKAIRNIPIPEAILGLLKEHMSERSEDFFLTGGSDYMEPRILQYRFHIYIQEAGLENVNFHMLRHTFATRCIEIGFDIKSLSEILGHADIKITLNRYTHSSFALKKQNMDKLKLQGSASTVKS